MPLRLFNNLTHKILYRLQSVFRLGIIKSQANKGIFMTKGKKRPVNLNLMSFKFPPMALISIAHRISGVLLFLALPILLLIFGRAMHSPASFLQLQALLLTGIGKVFVWLLLVIVLFHLLAGLRHLVMDMGFGESLNVSRITAYLLMLVMLVVMILLGMWLW